MDARRELPIAVLDSGVGGISVLRELVRIMPQENYIYFGDSQNAPYGSKSKSEVLELTKKNLAALKERGIKAFVIACNTATSAAVRVLRDENPELIIVGIEPAIKPASEICERPRVIVMATALTLREEKFKSLVNRFSGKGEFIPLPCHGLVELIEKGDLESDDIDEYLAKLFAPYKDEKIDGIVLGCTHYPHVRSMIAKHFPADVKIIDGGEGTARHTKRKLLEAGLLRDTSSESDGKIEIINTSQDEKMIEISKKLLYR